MVVILLVAAVLHVIIKVVVVAVTVCTIVKNAFHYSKRFSCVTEVENHKIDLLCRINSKVRSTRPELILQESLNK